MKLKKMIASILLFGFLLGVYEGNVAVWMDGKKEPVRVFPYSVTLLPMQDQKRLERGLHFNSIGELKNFIEEYLSGR